VSNVAQLANVFEFVRNGKSVRQDKSTGGLPITRIETIADGTVDSSRVGYAGLQEAGNERWLLQKGDILFSHINSVEHIGKCALYEGYPEKLVHGMNLLALRPDNHVLDARYAYRVMSSPSFRASLQQFVNKAVNQASISATNLKSLEIPLPPPDEQRRIAAILDKADALRRKRKRALDLLNSLTQSIFLEMFGDLVKSRDYPRGTISDWVADFDTGKNLAPDPDARQINGYRVLKVSAVTTGIFLPDESKPLPVGYEPPASHIVKKGDMLFSRANTADLIGATAYVESTYEKLVLPDKIWRFVWRQTNIPNSQFIHALFSTPSFRHELSKRATGTSGSMKNISKPKVLGIEIALPNRRKQDEFAVRHRAIQRSMSATVKQAAMLEDQFASLQSLAFSGQL
jgi:type I restriction enzyme S subunit